MIIKKMHLPRRTFLRGLGASIALPLLDAMVPALTAQSKTAAAPVRRLGIFYVPNGMSMKSLVADNRGQRIRAAPNAVAAGPLSRSDARAEWACVHVRVPAIR